MTPHQSAPRGPRRRKALDESLARQGLAWSQTSRQPPTDGSMRNPAKEIERAAFLERARNRQRSWERQEWTK